MAADRGPSTTLILVHPCAPFDTISGFGHVFLVPISFLNHKLQLVGSVLHPPLFLIYISPCGCIGLGNLVLTLIGTRKPKSTLPPSPLYDSPIEI